VNKRNEDDYSDSFEEIHQEIDCDSLEDNKVKSPHD